MVLQFLDWLPVGLKTYYDDMKAGDIIWSQCLRSSDWTVEPQYQVSAHTLPDLITNGAKL